MNFAWKNILAYPEFNEESEFHSGFGQKRDFDDFPDFLFKKNPKIPLLGMPKYFFMQNSSFLVQMRKAKNDVSQTHQKQRKTTSAKNTFLGGDFLIF